MKKIIMIVKTKYGLMRVYEISKKGYYHGIIKEGYYKNMGLAEKIEDCQIIELKGGFSKMTLTKKDFFYLAGNLRDLFNSDTLNKLPVEQQEKIKQEILKEIEDFCRNQNGLFDTGRFEAEIFKEK